MPSNGITKIESKLCQAKGCVKFGELHSIARWDYLICNEHHRLLYRSDQLYIARTLGTIKTMNSGDT